jgi:hypothetical protein
MLEVLAAVDPALPALGGFGAIIIALSRYMLKQMQQNSRGTWTIVRETKKENHILQWRVRSLEYELAKERGTSLHMLDPGPYRPPTPEEEAKW